MKRFSIFLLALGLTACAQPPATPNPPPAFQTPNKPDGAAWYRFTASETESDRAMSLVRGSLKDPGSANFKDIYKISRGQGDDIICGHVNAKNSYGGYVGFKQFYVKSGGEVVLANDDFYRSMANAVCSKPVAP